MRNIGNKYWEEGYKAYFDCISRKNNPYRIASTEFDLWEDGWDNADSDCDDE